MAVEIPHYEYQFEIETILTQFIALIDGVIVMRYDKNHQTGERILRTEIKPHYVFGPKTRIIYQITSGAKNYILPLVSINLKGIKVDKERIADKHENITRTFDETDVESYKRPVPITIDTQVTIIAKYMTDLYQICGRFISQFQPYCVYSWAVPSDGKFKYEELRNKVEWDLNVSLDSRDKITEADEDHYTASLNFSIQGWIFPENKGCTDGIILDIGTSISPDVDAQMRTLEPTLVDQYEKDGVPYFNRKEFANAHPRIWGGYVSKKLGKQRYYFKIKQDAERITFNKDSNLLVLTGYNLEDCDVLIKYSGLKSDTKRNYKDCNLFKIIKETTIGEEVCYALEDKSTLVKGKKIEPLEQTQNKIVISLADISYSGKIDIIVCDDVDYDSLSNILGKELTIG